MKAKLAGLALLSGMSLAASAATFLFTPITAPNNTVLQRLGNQLTMEVTDGGADNVVFSFTNNGGIESSLSRVYFDDSPSNLFASFSVANQSPGVNFAMNANPPNLTRGELWPWGFFATDSAAAVRPRFTNGISNSSDTPGETLSLVGFLNTGVTFADVLTSLTAGSPSAGQFLRVGLRVIGIDQFNDSGSASFLDVGTGTPVPIPESSTFGMLLAGLGLITAIARRRQSER
jgi:hypothetical protein